MKVEIITIGDELMSGDVTDNNFSWLAERLWLRGYNLHWHTTVADDPEKMSEAFQMALRSTVVIVTGGLGPTSDDRTLAVAADTFDRKLVEDPEALAEIEKRLHVLGRTTTESQRKQALHPEGGMMFPNCKGTAPGCRLTVDGTHFIFLVGVPSEMHEQWENCVLPFLEELEDRSFAYHYHVFRCFGAPEAELEERLKDFAHEGIRLSFRLHFPEVLIKIAARGTDDVALKRDLELAEKEIGTRLGHYIYASGDHPIEEVLGETLTARKETLALAESCTGGLIANMITEVPGSSSYFEEGVVTYSNRSKEQGLGVSPETLKKYGAVSAEVAREMAEGIRERSGATYGIGVTGIAGPSGGTVKLRVPRSAKQARSEADELAEYDARPVGTVHIALATPVETTEKKYFFPFGRHYFKVMVAHVALHRLRRCLEKLKK